MIILAHTKYVTFVSATFSSSPSTEGMNSCTVLKDVPVTK